MPRVLFSILIGIRPRHSRLSLPKQEKEDVTSPHLCQRPDAGSCCRARGTTALVLGLAALASGRLHAAEVEPAPTSLAAELEQQEQPDWVLGSTAGADLVAPVSFTSVDPEETERLRIRAAGEVAPILRFVSSTADEVLAEVDERLEESRGEFQLSTATAFGPLPLDAKAFLGDDFDQFRLRWVNDHPEMFSPSLDVARAWATQMGDASLLKLWRDELRTMLSELRICEPELFESATANVPNYRLLPVPTREAAISLEMVALHGTLIDRDHLLTVPHARELFRQHFPAEESAGRFASQFIRPNTFYEVEATENDRAERANQVVALSRSYPAGTVIVRKGEVIGPRVIGALNDLHAQFSSMPPAAQTELTEVSASPTDATKSASVPPDPLAASEGWMNDVFLIGFPVALGATALAIGWLAFRLPWRLRALVPAGEGESGGSTSPVVLALRDSAVQSLYSQRQALLTDQDEFAEKIAELEARVGRLQPQIQSKIRAYETRIGELEAQLTEEQGGKSGEFAREITRLRRERTHQFAPDRAG